jgi:hypothetical protein
MLMTTQEVVAKIKSGATLYLAGDEQLLAQLPKGNWIGGTIPYFMDTDGGTFSQDKIFVQEQSAQITSTVIKNYGVDALPMIASDSPDDGFSIVIIPGMSAAHARYAEDAPDYPGLFMKQIVGWIAGVDLADIGKVAPKVYNGVTGQALLDQAVVLHATLAPGKMAVVGIVNLFEQGDGDVLRFETDGFTVENCLVNGQAKNFAAYLVDSEVDTLLPLVADYHGEMINVSLQRIDSDTGKVELYAPVFRGVEYRVAKPVTNYIEAFTARLPLNLAQPEFTCNCILNYLYSGLEGKRTGSLTGPVTFGEIAYQLLNQTLVYLQVRDV